MFPHSSDARRRSRSFSRQLIDSQEAERRRIAAELHDSLGQQLLVIKNQALLGTLDDQEGRSPRHRLDEILESTTQSLDEVRQIAYNLRPYHLDRLGLTNSIEDMIERVASSSKIQFLTDIAPIDGRARDRSADGSRAQCAEAACGVQDDEGDRRYPVRQSAHGRSSSREHRDEARSARKPCADAVRRRAPVSDFRIRALSGSGRELTLSGSGISSALAPVRIRLVSPRIARPPDAPVRIPDPGSRPPSASVPGISCLFESVALPIQIRQCRAFRQASAHAIIPPSSKGRAQ